MAEGFLAPTRRAPARLVDGLVAGALGAACMTPLRLLARRAGAIEKTVPEAIEELLAARLGFGGLPSAWHTALDQAMHASYGALLGGLYALAAGPRPRSVAAPGAAFGLATWAFAEAAVLPVVEAARPARLGRLRESAFNVASHLVFGWVTALAAEEFARAPHGGPRAARPTLRMG